ncbi:MAG TPA: hypothetical protein VKQ36_06780 [Ktedonobacterales bacterium]|nr:hypothetical protein [Ktedonobacterales bacterium]
MQTLPPALFLVLLELTVGSFVCLYALDLRGDSSRNFVIFQGVLYVIFAALTLGAMNGFASPAIMRGLGLDTPWLDAQGPLVALFSALLLPWNVLLWLDRQPRKGQKQARGSKAARDKADATIAIVTRDTTGEEALTPLSDLAAEDGPSGAKAPKDSKPASVTLKPLFALPGVGTITIREIRFALGGLTAALGLASVFVVGMAYRTLASSRLDGAFLVGAFVLGALALGGVMTAMLLGHWYLNTPTASGKPLEFVTTLMLGALALELVCSLLIGPSTAHPSLHATTVSPGTTIQTGPGGTIIVTTPTPGKSGTPVPGVTPTPQSQSGTLRQAPLSTDALAILQYLLGFVSSLALGAVALYLTRGRSFQSATGMLYLCVSFVFLGEIIGRALLLLPIF